MKKLICLVLTLAMLISVVAVSTSALSVDKTQSKIQPALIGLDPTEVPTEVPTEEPAKGNVLHFDTNSVEWENEKNIFCHIWAYGGDSLAAFQSKREACTDTDGDGIFTYDLDTKNIALEEGQLYACFFSSTSMEQTYNLLFDTTVLGDTAYCDGTVYEDPYDNSNVTLAAFWRNQDPSVYGPEKCITSIGNVIGTCIPFVTDVYGMYDDFLLNKLEEVRLFAYNEDGTFKNDQQILDHTATQLGLTKEDVKASISRTGVEVEWDIAASTIPEVEPPTEEPTEAPTDAPTEAPTEAPDTFVRVDGDEVYAVEKGQIFTYTYYLQTDKEIYTLEATTYYDASGLKVQPVGDEWDELDIYVMFPRLNNVMANVTGVDGQIAFNYSEDVGVNFPIVEEGAELTTQNALIVMQFEVTGEAGVYDISTQIRTLAGKMNEKYISDYEVVNEDVVIDRVGSSDVALYEKKGDADLDGVVSIVDATNIQRHIASIQTLKPIYLLNADIDKDDLITIVDATNIQRYLAGKMPNW